MTTTYPNSACEAHFNVETSEPVCIICMQNEIAALEQRLAEAEAEAAGPEVWAEVFRLREEILGPDGYATWKEAALAERLRTKRTPLTLEYIDNHIGPDEGDREAVLAIVREVERAHGIAQENTHD